MRASGMVVAAIAIACAGCSHATKADRLFANGEYVGAIREYGLALRERESGDVAFKRACAFGVMGHGRCAREDVERAAGAGSLEARAILSAGGGRVDVEAAEALVKKNPRKGWVWALYADCLLRARRWEEASEAYEAALSLGVEGGIREKALCKWTVVLLEMKRYDQAGQVFDELTGGLDRPLDDAERRLAGLVAYARGDRRAAARWWRGLPPTMRREIACIVGDEGGALAGL